MQHSSIVAVILAAGRGRRMNSSIPKPLVKVKNKPILSWIIDSFNKSNIDSVIVVNPNDKDYFKPFETKIPLIYQDHPKGTGHALQQAYDVIDQYDLVFAFVGDSPFVDSKIIDKMYKYHINQSADCTILSAEFSKPFPYARIIRSADSSVIGCVEEKNASLKQRTIKELFCSHYLFNSSIIQKYIMNIEPDSDNQEIYLTDIINILIKNKKKVSVLKVKNWKRLVGLNTKEDVDWIESQDII